jgi:hypothetical protein
MGILQRSNDALKRLIYAIGMRLMVTASDSSNLADPTYSHCFNRKVYVDTVSYLLKGLPRDLDDTEIEILDESMPLTLREATRRTDDMKPTTRNQTGHHTILHRGTQIIITELMVWVWVMCPHMLFLLRRISYYQYKISENIIRRGATLANAASLRLSRAISNIRTGSVRQVLLAAIALATQDIASGFLEGIKVGSSRIARRSS